MKRNLETKLQEVHDLLDVQKQTGNYDYDPYMHGLYNGMEMITSVIEEREPIFLDAPKEWLCDMPKVIIDNRPIEDIRLSEEALNFKKAERVETETTLKIETSDKELE